MAHDSYSALSDPTRRRILTALSHGARPVGELVRELEVSQPTVSKHLKVLRDVGLVTTRAEGQRRYYSIEAETLAEVARWIEELIGYLPAQVTEAEPEAVEAESRPAPEAVEAESRPAPEAVASETEPEAAEAPEPEEEPEAQGQPAASEPEAGGEPEPPAPESRALPWFTAVEAAQTEVEEQLGAPGAAEGAEPEAVPVPELAAQQSQGGTDPAADGPHTDLLAGRTEEAVREESAVSQAENRDAGSTVETNTDVDSAESSEDSHGSAESPLTKPESGLPPVRSGAAHRRQGGLLSTLTGFRRRGRGPRR